MTYNLVVSVFLIYAGTLLDDPFKNDTTSTPNVEITLPVHNETYTWGSQVRYSINVEDETDGESRYDEINSGEVFLEIEFISTLQDLETQKEEAGKLNNNGGLTLIGRSSCFGCHADKSTMVGPSFSDISNRYKATELTTGRNIVTDHIQNGTIGNWGDIEMPAYPDFTEEEVMAISEYILRQGAKENRWVMPGLEGVFRVMDQPDQSSSGYYLLTASYTSSIQQRGQHSVVLRITE